jgi:hypothetical protein
VQEKLGVRFIGVGVQVGAARMRLLGGILVSELRLAKSDALDRRDFLYVPNAVIYHDKEQLLQGKAAIRRVELIRPQLRIIRERDGRFNVAGILGPVDLAERMPTIVIRDGVVLFEDRATSASPLLEIRDVQLTMINDPLLTLQIEGTGSSDVVGPVRIRASIPRTTLAARIELELQAIRIDRLAERAAVFCPELSATLAHFSGVAQVEAKLQLPENPAGKLTHDISLRLSGGGCTHPFFPRPLEKIEFSARMVDGVVPLAQLKAQSGPARLEARLARLRLPCGKPDLTTLVELLDELDFSVSHLDVDDTVLSRLPPDLHFVKEDFSPAGPLSASYRYRRKTGTTSLCKEWTIEPEGMTGSFIDFPYPVKNVRGTIWLDTSAIPRRNIRLNLTGQAGDQLATLRGTIQGEKKISEVVLDLTGKDILLDDRLMNALREAPRAQNVARQFLPAASRKFGLAAFPMGRGDFDVAIRRAHGQERLQKSYTITFRNCAIQYDQFPLPLEDVSAVLLLHPDHWEIRNFRGRHSGGELLVEGRSFPTEKEKTNLPRTDATPPERVQIQIRGKNLLLDHEFENALVPMSGHERQALQAAWKRLRLTGRLSFSALVIDHPGQPQDIDVSADVQGCSMQPAFFDYAFEELSGSVRYARGRISLRNMKARHGTAQLGMESGLMELCPEGGFKAWLFGITARQVPADDGLLHALPESLRQGLKTLELKTPFDVATKLWLVAPAEGRPMEAWWEGAIGVTQATFRAGVEVSEASGQLFCKGYHDGHRLRGISGHVHLDRASVLGQPLTKLFARLDVEPSSPDVLRVRDLKAELFGGTIAGEGRLETSPLLRYDVLLEALGVQLELLGRHNFPDAARQAQLSGPASASLHLTGKGNDLLNLEGNGRIDVPQGKMGQLPVLLDLVKAFGLRVPDRTAFEQAQMVFAIEGPQVQVQQLDLFGNAISLRGQGKLDIDGSNLELDFSATPGRVTQFLPAGIDVIPQAISGQFLKIKMRGKLGKGGQIKFDKELIPGIVEPLRRLVP